MKKKITVLFCLFCNSIERRNYLEVSLKSVLSKKTFRYAYVILIDGSEYTNFKLNQKIYNLYPDLKVIHDPIISPLQRIKNQLKKIKTKYVLTLLEDCIYLNFDIEDVIKDIKILKNFKDNATIQYPIINNQNFKKIKNRIEFKGIDFPSEILKYQNRLFYYRSIERSKYHYLWNSLIYNKVFFIKHFTYASKLYNHHASAEKNIPDFRFIKFIFKIRFFRKLFKLFESIFFSNYILGKIIVTETIKKVDVIHIGYESNETNNVSNQYRIISKKVKGKSYLPNLSIFQNSKEIKKYKFEKRTYSI